MSSNLSELLQLVVDQMDHVWNGHGWKAAPHELGRPPDWREKWEVAQAGISYEVTVSWYSFCRTCGIWRAKWLAHLGELRAAGATVSTIEVREVWRSETPPPAES